MPKVKKQVGARKKSAKKKVPTKERKSRGIRDRVQSVSDIDDGILMVVYGRSKTGKTRLASTFPKPAIILGTEKGTKSVSNVEGLDFLKLEEANDMELAVDMVVEDRYKTVILDTAGGFQDLELAYVLGLDEVPIQKSWGFCRREDWQVCGAQFKERVGRLIALNETHGVNVVIIAHERNFQNDDENTTAHSELLFPTVGAAVTPSVSNWLNGSCDYICQTYIRQETMIETMDIAGETVETAVPTGEAEYCLRIGAHPVYMTGFRLPSTVEAMPDYITNPNYDKIVSLIHGK